MAATIATLADGLRELEYKVVNNTYEISQLGGAAGVQYTEAATDTTITGTAVMWEDTSDTLRAVSAVKPFPVSVISGGTGVTISGVVAVSAGSAIIGKVGIDQTTPGSTNGTQQKQYTGAPSTFTVGTSDQTVFTLAAGEIGFIQNLDDAALAVKKGASASTTSFSLILNAGTAADDGKGGAILIDDWIGVVSVAAMAGSPRYIAWKQAA